MGTRLLLTLLLTVSLCGNWPCIVIAEETQAGSTPLTPAEAKPVDFARDIRPIFERACLRCHGPEKQKGEFRVDVRDIALTKGESYAPNILPGRGAASPLIKFVSGSGDLVMPPEGQRLTADEIGLLRAWIDQGATWPDALSGTVRDKRDLWSLKPLIRPDVPKLDDGREPRNAIDNFVQTKLAQWGFAASPEADRRTLIRRVFFDLIGLPPSPHEVDEFVIDPNPKAYETLIDRLLASPRYGERWARHWLDAAHFAETHGHDQDRIRENAWPYRDYLIAALNRDTPYGRFVEEQIACDALFPEEPGLTPALGFLAAGPWDESSLRDIREDSIDRQIARYLDRDDMLTTVMNNVVSLTVQCARCHDHKFDPISQPDYYALQAVFSGVERANRSYDSDPQIHRERQALARRKQDLEQRTRAGLALLRAPDVSLRVRAWEAERAAHRPDWRTIEVGAYSSAEGATLTKLDDGSILSTGPRPDKDTVTLTSTAALRRATNPINASNDPGPGERTEKVRPGSNPSPGITAIRLDVLTEESLPQRGPGRQDNGNFHLSEFEVYADGRNHPETLINPVADFDQSGWDISKAIDQRESTAWGIDPQEGRPHYALFEFREPLVLNQGSLGDSKPCGDEPAAPAASGLRVVLKQLHGRSHLIGRMKISVTETPAPWFDEKLPPSVSKALSVPEAQRTDDDRLELARHVLMKELEEQLSALPKPALVYAAAADFEPDGSLKPPAAPRPIHLLHRGDIHQPRDEILPGALSSIEDLPARFVIPADAPESARRAALAKWLTDRKNPLTWRSIVNRVWRHHFGQGLVGTPNDFGHLGESPSHPELLDWLSVEFRDGGQSLKNLHRLILLSSTYRQSVGGQPRHDSAPSSTDPRLATDSDNRLLWKMNRIRLDAEAVRDAVLVFAGRLDFRMGGPSDRQFELKPGIHVTPSVDYAQFNPNSDAGRRRSVYRFLFRTLPDPFMEALDCPSGDQIVPARLNSVTVQQALAMWNDSFMASQCEQIANRVVGDLATRNTLPDFKVEPTPQAQARFTVQLILGRAATEEEAAELGDYSARHGLSNLCRLLLNCNEFLFVN